MIPFTKAHAYGNDFLYVPAARLPEGGQGRWAQKLCDRHRGLGSDGLILYEPTGEGARMSLFNADGSPSELSGNGVRGLAAVIARDWPDAAQPAGRSLTIETVAGPKQLRLKEVRATSYLFAAQMGHPTGLARRELTIDGETVTVSVLAIGNPQCVVLGPLPDESAFARLGPALERHPAFPDRTNVEFAHVLAPDRVAIRIWERGVGPTASSGTGSCAAAVAACAHGGAGRDVEVIAPGGSQRVEWTEAGLTLTGWAEIVADGTFRAEL